MENNDSELIRLGLLDIRDSVPTHKSCNFDLNSQSRCYMTLREKARLGCPIELGQLDIPEECKYFRLVED